MALQPGTPEFEARRRALEQNMAQTGGGAQQAGAASPNGPIQQFTPPNLNLGTNVGSAPDVERFSAPTSNDPRLAGLADEAARWHGGLSAGSDQDATLALQRARDLQSGARSGLANQLALESGFGGARNQKLAMLQASQGRDLAGMNADLAADARAKQLGAFQTRSGLEEGVARERLGRGQLQLQGTQANNAANLGRYAAQNNATLAAQGLNLQAWEAAQNASAAQQRLAMEAQNQNNQNLWRAFQIDPKVLNPAQTQQTTPSIPQYQTPPRYGTSGGFGYTQR